MVDFAVRVLIVDDEEVIRKNIVSKIHRLQHGVSYETFEAQSAAEAETQFARIRPDIVITDIRMPGRSGLSLVRTLRAQDSRCILLILSGHDDFSFVREGFLAGINDYLLKPLAFSELDEKLRAQVTALQPDSPAHETPEIEDRRQKIEEYIEKNLSRGPTMSECAESCGMSYSHFSRIFKELFDCSWSQYVNIRRMALAAELLSDPTARIGEIAAKLGYEDPNHFSRTFQRVYGVYPSEFRKKGGKA